MNKAKSTRLRRRKPGNLGQLRSVLWQVLLEVETIATTEGVSRGEKLKAAHALSSLAGSYAKIVETHDLEERITALEAAQEAGGLRRAA